MTSIREATADDGPAIVRMGMRFLETEFGHLVKPEADALSVLVLQILGHGVIFLAEREHANDCSTWGSGWPSPADVAARACNCGPRVVGMLAIIVLKHPFTGLPYGDEVAWWVEPEYRKGLVGVHMLRHSETWARQIGLSALKMVAPAGSDVGAFYKRRGYIEVETAYQKSLEEHADGILRGRNGEGGRSSEDGEDGSLATQ